MAINKYTQDPDTKLMLEFQNGDELAFRKLFYKYKNLLINLAIKYVGNKNIAEELTQEVFLKVYKAKITYKPKAKFITWIYRIAINTFINELKKYENKVIHFKIWEVHPNDPESVTVQIKDENFVKQDLQVEYKELLKEVTKLLQKLPERQRIAFILRRFESFSYAEISEVLKCSEKAVKSLLNRSKKLVNEHFEVVKQHSLKEEKI
ncbi:MAG: RNA polymerase sigma factor [Pseudomonadota bacterium]